MAPCLPACVPYSYTCPRSAQDLLAAARGASVSVPFRARLVQKGAIKMLDLLETSTARTVQVGTMAHWQCWPAYGSSRPRACLRTVALWAL